MSDLVSIIVPTHNRPELLAIALASIKAQTYPTEAIVVNDGGIDVSRECFEHNAIMLVHKENRGMVAAINTGFAAASGAYIGQLADDDRLYPNHCVSLVAALGRGKAAHSHFLIRYERQEAGEWRLFGVNNQVFAQQFDPGTAWVGGNIALPSLLVRREVYEAHGPFDEDSPFSDLDLILFAGTRYGIGTVPVCTGEILTRIGGGHWGRKHCTGEEGVTNIRKLWVKYPTLDPIICLQRASVEQFLAQIKPEDPYVFGPTHVVE